MTAVDAYTDKSPLFFLTYLDHYRMRVMVLIPAVMASSRSILSGRFAQRLI